MGLRDHVRSHYFTDSFACRSAGVDCRANRSNVAAHDRGYQSGIDLFPTDQTNVGSFDHRVRGFDHRDQTATFNQSECFRHQRLLPKITTVFANQFRKE
jgi:hypothetical protein